DAAARPGASDLLDLAAKGITTTHTVIAVLVLCHSGGVSNTAARAKRAEGVTSGRVRYRRG
ncbi:hypothetical protein ACWEQJ_29900, partial [Streptomyces cyaneofuscatus]